MNGKRTGWVKGTNLWIRPGADPTGLVMAVRRSLGKAVLRNRLKRRLRVAYRHCCPDPTDIVVFPQPGAVEAALSQLEFELRELLRKLSESGDT